MNLSTGDLILVVSVMVSAIVGSIFVVHQFKELYVEVRALNRDKAEKAEMLVDIAKLREDILERLEKKADENVTTMRFNDGTKNFSKIMETLDTYSRDQKQMCLQQNSMNIKLENIWNAIEKRNVELVKRGHKTRT
ncbi:hypothetical protein KO465_04785 [Candidatus Micrarchaeota archaeon]|nr:hypothetical protein [Candidatus Micrarchaeota archaeon]